MITQSYNPSPLETELANIIEGHINLINDKLKNKKIIATEVNMQADNPVLSMEVLDDDGDKHHLVIKIIQKPDE